MSEYMLEVQHGDGSIDLSISNIRSAPDTGFAVRPMSKAYAILSPLDEEWALETCSNIGRFLRKARTCLTGGKVHTPNHRWVVVAAMGEINRVFPSRQFKDATERYLSEGVDVNEEGMYVYERSNSSYSWISNRAFIDIARLWKRPRLLDHVRRSLDFLMFNVHPNGEVVDEYSRRQDRGTHSIISPLAFECYTEMALRDGNPNYAWMADWAFSLNLAKGGAPAGYMRRESFAQLMHMRKNPPPTSYERYFPKSGVVRVRKEKLSATIMADNFDNFFALRSGNSIIDSLKVKYNYWGWWNFNPKRVVREGEAYKLRDLFTGRTFRPGPKEVRLRTRFEIEASVRFKGRGFSIDLSTKGPQNIVMQIEFGLRPNGTLALGGRKYDLSRVKGTIYFDKDEATLETGGDRILIAGGLVQHKIWNGWRGFNPWERYGKRTVGLMMTPVSPLHRRIELTAV